MEWEQSSNKRLSIENAKRGFSASENDTANVLSNAQYNTPSSPPAQDNTLSHSQRARQPSTDDYAPQHIDVSEEVHRRLNESRLRRLMNTPSTSQKRKYDVFEHGRPGVEAEEEEGEEVGGAERSPFKRIRASGSFGGMMGASIDAVLKRKDGDGSGGGSGRSDVKKRRFAR